MYGTTVFCTQNLAVSGANQVLVNLLEGGLIQGLAVILSPHDGPMRSIFMNSGAVVYVGDIRSKLKSVTDIRLVICNTIMTADTVLHLVTHGIPHLWILHEWWPDHVLQTELHKRHYSSSFSAVIKAAMDKCENIVAVCGSQRELYGIKSRAHIIPVGVPRPISEYATSKRHSGTTRFLCMGVVCPRKNQLKLVEIFKTFAGSRSDVRLDIVGARYVRDYESEYANMITAAIGDDPRISLHEVTNDPRAWYSASDVLILNSLNEVTPLVICEAMFSNLPVIASNVAGIPEMFTDGLHGFLVSNDDDNSLLEALERMHASPELRSKMGKAGREHALKKFTVDRMVRDYARVARSLAPVTILIDMDGVIVDWDKGFHTVWCNRAPVDRHRSYIMQECVPESLKEEAKLISRNPGFFASLPPCEGAIDAVKHLASLPGFCVFICSSPLLANPTCVEDKVAWIKTHFGHDWVERLILTRDKTTVRGDILIDDKPDIQGSQYPTWVQLVFDQPYNQKMCEDRFKYRMQSWADQRGWKSTLLTALREVGHVLAEEDLKIHAPEVIADISPKYRKDYQQWRMGSPRGACDKQLEKIEDDFVDLMETHHLLESEDFEEIFLFRKNYRKWRMCR